MENKDFLERRSGNQEIKNYWKKDSASPKRKDFTERFWGENKQFYVKSNANVL